MKKIKTVTTKKIYRNSNGSIEHEDFYLNDLLKRSVYYTYCDDEIFSKKIICHQYNDVNELVNTEESISFYGSNDIKMVNDHGMWKDDVSIKYDDNGNKIFVETENCITNFEYEEYFGKFYIDKITVYDKKHHDANVTSHDYLFSRDGEMLQHCYATKNIKGNTINYTNIVFDHEGNTIYVNENGYVTNSFYQNGILIGENGQYIKKLNHCTRKSRPKYEDRISHSFSSKLNEFNKPISSVTITESTKGKTYKTEEEFSYDSAGALTSVINRTYVNNILTNDIEYKFSIDGELVETKHRGKFIKYFYSEKGKVNVFYPDGHICEYPYTKSLFSKDPKIAAPDVESVTFKVIKSKFTDTVRYEKYDGSNYVEYVLNRTCYDDNGDVVEYIEYEYEEV